MQPKKKGSVECPLCGWENQKLLASRLRARVLCFPEESCLKNTDTHTRQKHSTCNTLKNSRSDGLVAVAHVPRSFRPSWGKSWMAI